MLPVLVVKGCSCSEFSDDEETEARLGLHSRPVCGTRRSEIPDDEEAAVHDFGGVSWRVEAPPSLWTTNRSLRNLGQRREDRPCSDVYTHHRTRDLTDLNGLSGSDPRHRSLV